MTLSRSTMFLLWMVVSQVAGQNGQNFKIESCRVEIMNSASEIVKLEHKPIHDQLLIEQNSDLTHIQRRPSTESMINVFLPGRVETLVEFDCVPTYSMTLLAHFSTMDGTSIISQFPLKSDNKYILKKHSSGFFYILRDKPMDQPRTKSLLSENARQTSSCEAIEEEKRTLQLQNLACVLEQASCQQKVVEGAELLEVTGNALKKSRVIIEVLADMLTELVTSPPNITIDVTSGRTDRYKSWRERNLSGTYHFRGIHDERPVYKREEKIEDGREAFLYYREENSGWLLTHGEDFHSKNGASWFIAKTEERDVLKLSGIWSETEGFTFDLKAHVIITRGPDG